MNDYGMPHNGSEPIYVGSFCGQPNAMLATSLGRALVSATRSVCWNLYIFIAL